MKRIGIFVFYDWKGQMDKYVDVLLNAMQEYLQKIVIIVNGKIRSCAYNRMKEYSTKIYIRSNLGYDAGAYKDAFTVYLVNEKWDEWDEIVLLNDTFYGPIYMFGDIFLKMENEDVDFWGLSRHPGGGKKLSTGEKIPMHIQGFFLVCKKSLFLSSYWRHFWNNLVYPANYEEAVEKFEINFSKYFLEKGYRAGALTDKYPINFKNGENPYLCYFQELIRDFKFPILKRKTFCLDYLEKMKDVLKFIQENTDYDINLIISHMQRLSMEKRYNPVAPFDATKLSSFYYSHKRVFIYGCGTYGKGISTYFEYKGWKFEGFILSEKKENVQAYVYREMKLNLEDGIILAFGKKTFNEVYPILKKDLEDEQLCYIEYE